MQAVRSFAHTVPVSRRQCLKNIPGLVMTATEHRGHSGADRVLFVV